MGTRFVLLAAAAVCLIPAVASAQAVPARKSPPQDERVPVVMDGAGKAAKVVGGGAIIVDTIATRARDGAAALDEVRDVDLMTGNGSIMDHPLADPHGGTIQAGEKVSGVAKGVAGAAAVVQLGTSAYDAANKCGAEKVDGSDCAQASLSLVSSAAGAMDAVAATPGLARLAGGAQLAADAVSLHKDCVSDQSNVGQCVLSSFDATMTATGMVPGGQAISVGYSVGKVIAPALVDSASYALYNKPLFEAYYDLLRAEKDMNDIADKTSSAAIEAHRAKLRAQYQQSKGNLVAKQAVYDAEQAQLEQQRQAEMARQAQAQHSNVAAGAFLGGIANSLQQARAPYTPTGGAFYAQVPTPTGNCTASEDLCNDLRNGYPPGTTLNNRSRSPSSAPTPSPRPPASSGCGLSAADRAAGKVCTAN